MSNDISVAGTLHAFDERWPIAGDGFTIARGAKREAHVVVVEITSNGHMGRGECVPYGRYGETVEQTLADIAGFGPALEAGVTRTALRTAMKPGAARNAIDCALWDIAAKITGVPVWTSASLSKPRPLTTAFTISLASPETMAGGARTLSNCPVLKLKLGASGDAERLRAVRRAVPKARLIVDANEGWSDDTVETMLDLCAEHRVALVEQPLPAGADEALAHIARRVPVCADESVHGLETLHHLKGRYDAVNIKLDKTGGLTEALAMMRAARYEGFEIMVGCMVDTSLSMAPAMLLGGAAAMIDLDGPLLLAHDRRHGIRYDGAVMHPPDRRLWGG